MKDWLKLAEEAFDEFGVGYKEHKDKKLDMSQLNATVNLLKFYALMAIAQEIRQAGR